jgi:hypothetical protein
MANPKHLAILRDGVNKWNQWRSEAPFSEEVDPQDVLSPEWLEEAAKGNPYLTRADLSGTDLSGAMLRGVNFQKAILNAANLQGANLVKANLFEADLRGANLRSVDGWDANLGSATLSGADLRKAFLRGANLVDARLKEADLRQADISYTDLRNADFRGANLDGADLSRTSLIATNFENAHLTDCHVYGVSAWDVQLRGAVQSNLLITPDQDSAITVDNLEVAQFIYLILNNERLRQVIDSITSKAVLILGRFTPERKAVLDAIRAQLRERNYVPILFDFDKPASRDTHETITTLARMARFVIADITEPRSIPQELVSIVEQLPSVPVQPILQMGAEPWGMYDHIRRYPWVLDLHRYTTSQELLVNLYQHAIAPAEKSLKKVSQ